MYHIVLKHNFNQHFFYKKCKKPQPGLAIVCHKEALDP